MARPEVIIATNTSSITITGLAAATSRPDRFIGMHFFNPVPMMALVEVIRGLATSDATYAVTEELAKKLGKMPISVKNHPGFVVNRILCPMINEAIFVLAEGLASAEDIDNGMRLGTNQPIGPLALADMIGLDTMLSVMQVFYEGFNDSKYRPAPLLKEMVAAGYLRAQDRPRVLHLQIGRLPAQRNTPWPPKSVPSNSRPSCASCTTTSFGWPPKDWPPTATRSTRST